MTRQLTITAAEWASVQPDGTLWLAWEGETCSCPPSEGYGHVPFCPPCTYGPCAPVEFVQACAPCFNCDDKRLIHHRAGQEIRVPYDEACSDCCIELVGPCVVCNDEFPSFSPTGPYCSHGTRRTPGHAYAIGQPLPIQHGDTPFNPDPAEAIHVARVNGRWKVGYRKGTTIYTITDRLAHYGLPETLVGRWAIQLRVVQP